MEGIELQDVEQRRSEQVSAIVVAWEEVQVDMVDGLDCGFVWSRKGVVFGCRRVRVGIEEGSFEVLCAQDLLKEQRTDSFLTYIYSSRHVLGRFILPLETEVGQPYGRSTTATVLVCRPLALSECRDRSQATRIATLTNSKASRGL